MLARKQEAPKLPRVPEVLLLALAGLGGGAGAIAGIFLVRHKTRKPRFVAGVPAIVLLEVGVACVALWLVPAAMDFVMSPG
ncbi:DUF1294 domain-containing protein [bacterium]|nr:DUF1294 domain-containing protein [bacterium]